ncbi:MAG: NAD-dependent epimerase/dehydratase family protein [Thiobacillus sp.]|nr:NAD-dependent epimerase/dehydratase family protein [Thiobacillus sp.]MDP2056342.1 NAD-dependent epimerase/dehydratase family protein [Thiobacillus sp.]
MNPIASTAPTSSRLDVGGAGYIGSHRVKHLLRRGGDVVIFGNLSARCHSPVRKGISMLLGNLADRANPVTSLLRSPAYDKHRAADGKADST